MFKTMMIAGDSKDNDGKELKVGGFNSQKELLKEVIEMKLFRSEVKVQLKGVLLHGPSGIGKSMLL